MTVDSVGKEARASFGDSWLNIGRVIRLWLAGPVLHTFVQYLIAFCSQPETASDIKSCRFVGSILHNKRVKCRDPRFYPKPSEAAFSTVFAARRSDSFYSGICNRIRVGRAGVNGELIGTHGRAIEWAHPRPHPP